MTNLLTLPPITESALGSAEIHAIGLVAAEWGYAESLLELLIWTLAGIDQNRGRSITTHIGSVTRCHIAATLANDNLTGEKVIETKERFLKIIADFDALRAKRNGIIHAIWMIAQPSEEGAEYPIPVALKITAKGQLKIDRRSLDVLEMREIVKEVTNLIWRMSEILKELPALPNLENRLLAQQLGQWVQNPDPKTK